MSAGELILAAILLSTPPGTPEATPAAEQWPTLRDAIHKVAVDWEILDPRETRYILARSEDYAADLNLLRRRYVELHDAPRVADSHRFPDRAAVNDLVRFNRAYRKHLDQRHDLETDRCEALRAVIHETELLYQVWDSVRDARCEFYYITVRRQALKKLQDLIGEEDYSAGNLPPNVPTWRFNELK
jgi:hypothetical protein